MGRADRLPPVSARTSLPPLRLALLVLLAVAALGTVQMGARRERGDPRAKGIVARAAAVRAPVARGVPAPHALSAALPAEAPLVAAALVSYPTEVPGPAVVRPARPDVSAPSARAPPR